MKINGLEEFLAKIRAGRTALGAACGRIRAKGPRMIGSLFLLSSLAFAYDAGDDLQVMWDDAVVDTISTLSDSSDP